jgi:signal transduction histidine kinase
MPSFTPRFVSELTLRKRLVITLAYMALVLVLPAFYAIERLDEIRDIAFDLKGKHGAAEVALSRLEADLGQVDASLRSYVADPSPESRAVVFETLGRTRTQLAGLTEAGYQDDTAAISAAIQHLEYVTLSLERLLYAGEVGRATDYFFEDIQPVLRDAKASLIPVSEAVDRQSDAATERAAELSSATATTIPIAVLISLGFAVLIGVLIIGKFISPLQRLRTAMSSVAQGEFEASSELSVERVDELGDLNRSFVSMTEQLAELNRIRAEFVSIVTHDLKTPINVLGGYAEMLQEGTYGELSEGQQGALSAMEEQAGVLLEQVNQLVDLSRYEAGAFQIDIEPLYLVDFCTSLDRAFEALAQQKGVRLEFNVDPQAPEIIEADGDRLRNEVLGNLLGNAFKFTDSGGRVSVKVRADLPRRDRVLIEVSDSGVGIPAEELPHVFDMYYQGQSGTRAKGSGIGLAIAREISREGRGTTFRVTLPVTQEGRERDASQADEAMHPTGDQPPDLQLVG